MTNKEMGEILANETLRVSQMQMEATKTKRINKQYWAMFHLGFIANMKLNGATYKDIDEVLEVAHKVLEVA